MITCNNCDDSNSFMTECLGCNKVLCVDCIAKGHSHGLDSDKEHDDEETPDDKNETSFIDDIKNLLTRTD